MPRPALLLILAMSLMACTTTPTQAQEDGDLWVTYEGTDGLPGSGKHVVLISGDDEYRSEEAMPQLGKILATQHGFTCTVLFAIDPDTGHIQPDHQTNIPGLEHLEDADLVVMALRFRDLPDDQMVHIDNYLKRGMPIIGLRTSTHAFNIRSSDTYKHYTWNNGTEGAWNGGFGRNVLGETWINHHGHHKVESCRGVITEAAAAENHPIVRGIAPGTIWGPSDVYGVRLPQPEGCDPLILGAVLTGMEYHDDPVDNQKNEPMMPIAWTKPYQLDGGEEGTAFTTTMGAATDLVAEGTRRMIVNAAYWLLEMDIPEGGTSVDLVGDYEPSQYGFGAARPNHDGYIVGRVPSDYAMEE